MEVKNYVLINKNSLISIIKTEQNYNFIFYDILSMINDYLEVLINNNVSYDVTQLNFEHLYCAECIGNDTNRQFVSNIIKFNIHKLHFCGSNGEVFNVDNSLNLMLNIVKSKLEKLNVDVNVNVNIKPAVQSTLPEQQKSVTNNKLQQKDPKIIKYENVKYDLPTINKSTMEIQQMDSVINDIESFDDELIIKDKTNTQSKIKINTNTNTNPFEHMEKKPKKLLKLIETLKELKKKEEEQLETLKSKTEIEDEKLSKISDKLGDEKRIFLRNKEREKENKNIFKADKKAYYLLKQDICEHKITEDKISILFKDKYPIFKFMDMKNLLNTEDEYIQYVNLYDELYPKKTYDIEGYVPHNIHYLDDTEKNKYNNIKTQNKDMISDFLNNKIPPLEEVLAAIDNDDQGNCFTQEQTENNQFGDVTFDLDM